MLEAARQFCRESPFIHMSTNKVYSDRPNTIALKELETRWDYAEPAYENGIPEDFSIDQSKHSIFGALKVRLPLHKLIVKPPGRAVSTFP